MRADLFESIKAALVILSVLNWFLRFYDSID